MLTSMLAMAAMAQTAEAPKIGATAPSWTLTDTKGKSHRLEDFRGKYVVMEWTNHQCPVVVRHYQNGDMQATQKWATEKGVVWVNIVSSAAGKQGHIDADQGNQIMKSQGWGATALLLDPNGQVGRRYGARTTPHMFVVNPEGKVIYMGAIDDKPNGPAREAKNLVKAALEDAWAGRAVAVSASQPYGCSVKY